MSQPEGQVDLQLTVINFSDVPLMSSSQILLTDTLFASVCTSTDRRKILNAQSQHVKRRLGNRIQKKDRVSRVSYILVLDFILV